MKLYEFKNSEKEVVQVLLEDGYTLKEARLEISEYFGYEGPDLRSVKSVKTPNGRFECMGIMYNHHILYNGEVIVSWDDTAVYDYPEDLTWNRDIGILIEQVEKLKELEFADNIKRRR